MIITGARSNGGLNTEARRGQGGAPKPCGERHPYPYRVGPSAPNANATGVRHCSLDRPEVIE